MPRKKKTEIGLEDILKEIDIAKKYTHEELAEKLTELKEIVSIYDDLVKVKNEVCNRAGEYSGFEILASKCSNGHTVFIKREDREHAKEGDKYICPICGEAGVVVKKKASAINIFMCKQLIDYQDVISRYLEKFIIVFPEWNNWGAYVRGLGTLAFAKLLVSTNIYSDKGRDSTYVYTALEPARYCEKCNIYWYGTKGYKANNVNEKVNGVPKQVDGQYYCPICGSTLKAVPVRKAGIPYNRRAKTLLWQAVFPLTVNGGYYKQLYNHLKNECGSGARCRNRTFVRLGRIIIDHLWYVHTKIWGHTYEPVKVFPGHKYYEPVIDYTPQQVEDKVNKNLLIEDIVGSLRTMSNK